MINQILEALEGSKGYWEGIRPNSLQLSPDQLRNGSLEKLQIIFDLQVICCENLLE